jgi:hypothetical protein
MASVTQGAFNINASGKVTIDEGYGSTNNVAITIKNNGATAKIRVTVSFKCGTMPDALMMAKDAALKLAFQATGKKAQDLTQVSTPGPSADWLSWETPSKGFFLDAGAQLSISISGFESNTAPGDAPLTVFVRTLNASSQWVPDSVPDANKTLSITKTAIQTTAPTVHYFAIDPDFILHAGDSKVTLGFYATGIDSVVLFRNNQEVQNWQTPLKADGVSGSFFDKPSITTVYRLEAKPKDTGKDTIVIYRTVQVISAGWNQLALPQGYPTRLFVSPDLTPGSGSNPPQRLYGIFMDINRHAALYSSATGVDDWRRETGDVPQGMATSPGVAFNNKLWLIGGDCVNPDHPGSDVWSYEKDTDTGQLQWKQQTDLSNLFLNGLGVRAGHACVVGRGPNGQDTIWILGGYNNGQFFNDVWTLKQGSWSQVNPGAAWAARYMHAAVCFVPAPDHPAEVWLYGGSNDGPLTDFWCTRDGGSTWTQCGAIVPAPGLPFGAALVSIDSDKAAGFQRLFMGGTFLENATGAPNRTSSFIFEWQWRNQIWEARPVIDGWERFEGSMFYMQSVSFNRFLFVWSLHTAIAKSRPKLNILIP